MKERTHESGLGIILCRSCGSIIAVQDTEKVTKYYHVCDACRVRETKVDNSKMFDGGSARE
jgi:hypothetical protein